MLCGEIQKCQKIIMSQLWSSLIASPNWSVRHKHLNCNQLQRFPYPGHSDQRFPHLKYPKRWLEYPQSRHYSQRFLLPKCPNQRLQHQRHFTVLDETYTTIQNHPKAASKWRRHTDNSLTTYFHIMMTRLMWRPCQFFNYCRDHLHLEYISPQAERVWKYSERWVAM